MRRCQVCGSGTAVMAWQPFGPNEGFRCFTTLGSHYRGFPVLAVCSECQTAIVSTVASAADLVFTYRGTPYLVAHALNQIVPF